MPQVPPKLVAPELIDEIKVKPTVAVHVGHGQARAMIVMDGFVVFGPVVDGVMFKADATSLLIEPSAAVAVAAALSDEFRGLTGMRRVGIILSGGNVNLDALPWLK